MTSAPSKAATATPAMLIMMIGVRIESMLFWNHSTFKKTISVTL